MIKNEQIIDESDSVELNKAQHYQSLGIIKLRELEYFNCKSANCEEKIYYNGENEIQCNSCFNLFNPEKLTKHKEYEVTLLENGIFEYLKNNLKKLQYCVNFNKDENVINLEKGNKTAILCVVDYCLNTALFEPTFNDSIMRIVCDYTLAPVKGIQQDKFFYLDQIITNEFDFEKKLKFIMNHEPTLDEKELVKLKTFLESPDSTGKNLEKFIYNLLKYSQENPELVQSFMLALEKNKENIFGATIVRLSGSGRTDITPIPLYPYLLGFFKSDNNYECKSWHSKEELTPEKLGAAVLHASDLNKNGIVAICTGKISPDNWQRAIKTNKLQIIIIDKFILMRIVNGLKAFSLLNIKDD